MAGTNQELRNARKTKNDEFYTQLSDIEKEMIYYREYFRGKTILCNCDDPYESNFFKYFALNFNFLGLKKLITTCYSGSPISGTELNLFPDLEPSVAKKKAYKLEITQIANLNGEENYDLNDVQRILKENPPEILKGNGDFRSDECVKFLKEADIVVTNPPFSLFREFVAQLMDYDKKFIIIGNQNAITYKEIFPLIAANKMWLGISIHSGDRKFYVPENYPLNAAGCGIDEKGKRFIRVKGVRWFTNFDNRKRHEEFISYKQYTPEEFPKYDNYDAIEVSKTADIPEDYYGIMGVPITFLDKYNPEQFEIIGLDRYTVPKEFLVGGRVAIKGKPCYARILIKRKK